MHSPPRWALKWLDTGASNGTLESSLWGERVEYPAIKLPKPASPPPFLLPKPPTPPSPPIGTIDYGLECNAVSGVLDVMKCGNNPNYHLNTLLSSASNICTQVLSNSSGSYSLLVGTKMRFVLYLNMSYAQLVAQVCIWATFV